MKSFSQISNNLLYIIILVVSVASVLIVVSCKNEKKVKSVARPQSFVVHPEWSKNVNIYEVNIRQYTAEGTFKAFEQHLTRLKKMDVNILWLMPIFPIGELHRKASQTVIAEEIKDTAQRNKILGSYYSTKDYYSVNPEFGTLDEFKSLVNEIHKLGMYVILDIAVNHTSWDNEWVKTHPDFYTRIEKGNYPWKKEWMDEHPDYYKDLEKLGMTYPISPNETDWWDVADLNYDNKELRNYMVDVLKFWVKETDIDGYRCDVAGMVPTDFWDTARIELDKVKPVFMLAEAEQPDLQIRAFDMTYAWELHHIMNSIAKGTMNPDTIKSYFEKQDTLYPANAYRMNFITNHDENTWNGTEFERLGNGVKTFAVLIYTLPGMPLTYSGQETGLNKRLAFFEKDTIHWDPESPWIEFYTVLNKLKTNNPALWNGNYGGSLKILPSTAKKSVLAFTRELGENKIFVITNLTDKPVSFNLKGDEYTGSYTELFSRAKMKFKKNSKMDFNPWEYRVYVQ